MKRLALTAAVIFIFLLAACGGLPAPLIVTSQPTAGPVAPPTNEQDCLAQGGVWGPQGLAQTEMCDLPATDAGQPCADSSQCQGLCLAGNTPGTGACSPRTLNFGCYDVIENGTQMAICID